MLNKLPEILKKQLKKKLSLTRLAQTGFFIKGDIPYQIEGELLLHRTVLDKALIDSFSIYRDVKDDIEEWLDLDNPDFNDACDRALLHPKGVYAVFKFYKRTLRGRDAEFHNFKKNS